MFSLMN